MRRVLSPTEIIQLGNLLSTRPPELENLGSVALTAVLNEKLAPNPLFTHHNIWNLVESLGLQDYYAKSKAPELDTIKQDLAAVQTQLADVSQTLTKFSERLKICETRWLQHIMRKNPTEPR